MRLLSLLIVTASASAFAQPVRKPAPAPAVLPKVGDDLPLAGAPDWPKPSWMYDAPSPSDAAGKVVVHWFCAPTPKAFDASCVDDLARIVTLRDAGRVYIVAYISGSARDAKKLDPIRESEGVGRGTVAYGPNVTKIMKQMGITAPTSVVVGVDGKVVAVTTSGDATQLDGRDAQVNALIGAIKEYTSSHDGPASVKAGDRFQLTFKVQLASWLAFSTKAPTEFTLSPPGGMKCDATTLRADQVKIDGHALTATVTCTASHGSYEVQGHIRFGYTSPGGAEGLGDDGATWKFDAK
ncbi:MAG TPA: hypothetical protein VLX92_33135 [Kofleriaceae bacterium]|nr:hypothetical protein [Kofleriaceae bacterium]